MSPFTILSTDFVKIFDGSARARRLRAAAHDPAIDGKTRHRLAGIIVFTRKLSDTERRGIECWLAERYHLPVRRWK